MGRPGEASTPAPGPLARSHSRMRERYDVVVVGSGYGGAIAACRFARAGRSVCVLERGREVRPGEFPDAALAALRQLQVRRGARRCGNATGLFELHADDDLSVLVGCGLGGTSLINAGVALRPPAWVYDDERWPRDLRGAERGPAELDPYFAAAEAMLGSTPYPESWRPPTKLVALGRAAAGVGATVGRPPLNVTFADGPNAAGVDQRACVLCGDCVTGCNHRAKNTLDQNYLPDAVAHGAEVFCQATVRAVAHAGAGGGGGWVVRFDAGGDGRDRFAAPSSFVFADVVVLAAGSLGSTRILLESRAGGLAVSPRLGDRFTGNGDVLAFAYGVDGAEPPLRGIGTGRRPVTPDNEVGPSITGMIDLTGSSTPGKGVLVEEGAIPGALRPLMPAAFAAAAVGGGGGPRAFATRLARRVRATARAVLDPSGGPAERSLTYLAMSDDVGDGRLRLDGGALRVEWPAVGDLPIFDHNDLVLRQATAAIGGEYVSNPLWSPTLGESLITVHPLGGCAMADDGAHGAVDHRGRVFVGEGDEVHDGLIVTDGAVVPRPLAVNPLLTISALAERAVALLAAERGWAIDRRPAPPRRASPTDTPPGLRFTERMAGWAGTSTDGDPGRGATRGRADGCRLELVLTIDIDDLPATLADPATPARLSGTVVAPAVSPRRLRVVDGTFRLAQEDPTHVDTWRMTYTMRLVADDGRRYSLAGHKVLHDRFGLDVWSDTTTLYVTIADDGNGRPVAAGVVRIAPGDLARQVSTMRVTGVAGRVAQARWLARFGRRFVRSLDQVYGSLDDVANFPAQPAAPVPLTGAGRRRLRLPAPEPRWCDGEGRWHEGGPGGAVGDDAWLRLVRYEGGRRGPVLLASGFGMSATSFLLDTVGTNLAEHLVGRGYDVWLFDYRASIDLPSARTAFTLDDIATVDWPHAVAEVRRVTGAGSVQALGHCVGSVSLLMALGAGLGDVRSAVCMQFTLHPVTSLLNQVKAAARLETLMGRIGMRTVAPLTGVTVPNTALDLALRAVPMPRAERCGKALCRWVNAIYGCTHAHDQLDDATHDQLDDMFGVGDLAALGHLGTIMQRRLAVDHRGAEVYTGHPERLRLPILLVQGDRNYIFRPAGSVRTLRWLQSANDASLYERAVLPGYAHLDALIGRDAPADVFPVLSDHLDRFNR